MCTQPYDVLFKMLKPLKSLFKSGKKDAENQLKFIENHSLYYYATCPFCFRVEIALKKLGIDMERRNIHQDPKHSEDLRNGGGSTMVPCLRIDQDGISKWLYESADIIRYLEENFSKKGGDLAT